MNEKNMGKKPAKVQQRSKAPVGITSIGTFSKFGSRDGTQADESRLVVLLFIVIAPFAFEIFKVGPYLMGLMWGLLAKLGVVSE
jgi:hypothetical protein